MKNFKVFVVLGISSLSLILILILGEMLHFLNKTCVNVINMVLGIILITFLTTCERYFEKKEKEEEKIENHKN